MTGIAASPRAPAPRRSFSLGHAVHPAAALLGVALGGAAGLVGAGTLAPTVWSVALALTGGPVVWRTLRGVVSGRFAAHLVATLAIVSALVVGQPLAGLFVVVMQTGGEALERYAEGRASRAVEELEAAAPRLAHRIGPDGESEDIAAGAVAVGDLLLVRPGELVPCDGQVESGRSSVDTSRLTGEPLPLAARPGTRLVSGSLNLDGPLTLRASAAAEASQYARIVALVRSAQASKTRLQRLADRYAVWFTPLTLVVCAAAYAVSGDPVRVLAVLVVATPCPLILATPVAVVGGINRAARLGIVFRHGGGLEQLADVSVAVIDKTGTLTVGRPRVARVVPYGPFSKGEVLRLAAAVERGSSHLLARTLTEEAARRGITAPDATDVAEAAGEGVRGMVEGREVTVGGLSYVLRRHPGAEPEIRAALAALPAGGLRTWIAVDGRAAGMIDYADQVRPRIPELLRTLGSLGVGRAVLLSGDSEAHVAGVARTLGIAEARGELLPGEKVAIVEQLMRSGARVVMLGDGTNDAPALAAATVGVALASGGGGITAETADAVILADDPGRLTDAIRISRRTLRVARQSIWAGLGLSAAAMVAAGLGYIPPIAGALLQEGIDVAVILNALRAARPAPPA
jgi:heavy metal translocating P-type ATPase